MATQNVTITIQSGHLYANPVYVHASPGDTIKFNLDETVSKVVSILFPNHTAFGADVLRITPPTTSGTVTVGGVGNGLYPYAVHSADTNTFANQDPGMIIP